MQGQQRALSPCLPKQSVPRYVGVFAKCFHRNMPRQKRIPSAARKAGRQRVKGPRQHWNFSWRRRLKLIQHEAKQCSVFRLLLQTSVACMFLPWCWHVPSASISVKGVFLALSSFLSWPNRVLRLCPRKNEIASPRKTMCHAWDSILCSGVGVEVVPRPLPTGKKRTMKLLCLKR